MLLNEQLSSSSFVTKLFIDYYRVSKVRTFINNRKGRFKPIEFH